MGMAPYIMKILPPLLVVLMLVTPARLWAGGVSVRVLETRAWLTQVLAAEAPALQADVRDVVARTLAEECTTRGVDPALALAVMKVESRFQTQVRSRRGASGLMQVMPRVANDLTGTPLTSAQLLDPETNVRLGVVLLGQLIREHGDLYEGVAAYNMGSRKVRGHLRDKRRMHARDFAYTRKVLHEAARLKNGYARVLVASN